MHQRSVLDHSHVAVKIKNLPGQTIFLNQGMHLTGALIFKEERDYGGNTLTNVSLCFRFRVGITVLTQKGTDFTKITDGIIFGDSAEFMRAFQDRFRDKKRVVFTGIGSTNILECPEIILIIIRGD